MGPKHGVIALEHSARNVHRDAAGACDSEVGAEQTQAEAIGFAELYELHFDFVWRSLRLLGVPAEAIEDVVQDTFDVASRQLRHFEGRSSLRTWLFGIAQRVAANYRRMARRKLSRLDPLSDSAASSEPSPQAHAEAREAAGVVERFVEELDADWRAVFVLAVLEGVPGSEVAAALGISVNAVYTRVHALREGLRRAFEQQTTQHTRRGQR
jgi:RNA polymerase sigma-70 factor, ECF subfamily